MSVFLNLPKERILFKGEYFLIIKDGFPVSPGHILIISNKLKADYFSLSKQEKLALVDMIDKSKKLIEKNHSPDGYNIGMNCGESAGQTVMHFHCHVIPRYIGDMDNPRGGIRYCIPEKGNY